MDSEFKKTILLVEDDAFLSVVQTKKIRNFGYDVLAVNSGEKAVRTALENTKINLILMDIDLGSGINGSEAAEQILSTRNIPIVFLTAHSEKEMVEKVRGITRYGYILKDSGDFVLQSSIEMAFELFNAHEKTRENEERYRELYNNINSGVAVYEAVNEGNDFIFRDLNRAGERIDNCRMEDLVGKLLTEMRPDVKRFGLLDVLKRVWETGEPQYHPVTFYTDGIIQGWYENFVYKLRSGEIVAVFENVTERKSHEQKLTVTLAKYRVLFDNFPLGISVSDSEGNILEVNAMSEKLLGISSIQHIHRKINSSEWRIIRPDGSPMPAEEFASVIALRENRLVENIEMGIVKPDNEITWISVTAAPVPLKGYGVVITYSDITEHRRSEQKVRALISEKEFLLMEANHRMKNNMNIINSLLILQAETMNEPSAKDALLNAAQRVRNLQSLYEKLFLLPGDSAMSVKDFLTGLVDEIISSFTESVDLRVVKEIDDFTLEAKKLQLLGIIINELLSNTMKYAFKGRDSGHIEVSAELSGSRVKVIVSDDGSGVPDTVDFHKSTGFDMMLVGFMAGSLDGEIRIERGNGTKIILEFDK